MNKIKVAVMVSGGGTNLQAIIDACKSGIITHAEVALVVSNKKSAYALQRASDNNIPSVVFTKKDLGSQEAFEKAIITELDKRHIDLIVLAGFLSILSEDFTRRYSHRIINIHPSLIPSFCGQGYYGLKVHEAALERGVKITGATVHYVNEIPDGGEIILQKAVKVNKGDTPEKLQLRVMKQAEWKILPEAIELVSRELLEQGGNK